MWSSRRLLTVVSAFLAAGGLAAAPTAAKKAARPAAKSVPVVGASPAPTPEEPAVMDGEHRVSKGEASWKLGRSAVRGAKAEGTIQTSNGFKIATLSFPAGRKEKLSVEFMFTGPGPVDPGYLTKVFAVDGAGRYHAWKKGVGECRLSLARASSLEIEGTLDCPRGLLDMEDRPAKPITEATFHVLAAAP